jgi:phospholipid transport system substrate-binding protein
VDKQESEMTHRRSLALGAAAALLALSAFGAPPALAQTPDPAATRIAAFDDVLLAAMHLKTGRGQAIAPAIDSTFNVGAMAEFIVGASWAKFSPSDKQAVTVALTKYTVARFAHDFDAFDGQQFFLDPNVQSRGPDKLVRTKITDPGDTPDLVDYRMRAYNGDWKIIDVYYNGVSELATQRADVASTLATGDVAALVTKIEQAAEKLR